MTDTLELLQKAYDKINNEIHARQKKLEHSSEAYKESLAGEEYEDKTNELVELRQDLYSVIEGLKEVYK